MRSKDEKVNLQIKHIEPKRILGTMNKRKKSKFAYGITGTILIILCFLFSFLYRPYAYLHHLNDFHIADSYTSFLGVPIIVCLTQALRNEKWNIPTNILYATFFLIGWEIVDGLFAKQFDWVDIIACILGGMTMYVFYRFFNFKSIDEYDER